MELVLAYDGSPSAREALMNLGRCALPPGAAVAVLAVDDVSPETGGERSGPVTLIASRSRPAGAGSLAMAAAAQVSELLPDLRVIALDAEGDPAVTIAETVLRRRSGLVVLGAGATTGMLGSTTHEVLRETSVAVRIVRVAPDLPSRAPAHVVVGIDGSEDSLRLIHAVASRAWPVGSRIWLVTARDDDGRANHREDVRIIACHTLWADMLRSGYIEVASVMEDGPTVAIIDQVARTVDAELILLAAAHRPSTATIAHTSIAEAIASVSPCPVEIW